MNMNKLAQIQSAIIKLAKLGLFKPDAFKFTPSKPNLISDKAKTMANKTGTNISHAIKSTNLSFNR